MPQLKLQLRQLLWLVRLPLRQQPLLVLPPQLVQQPAPQVLPRLVRQVPDQPVLQVEPAAEPAAAAPVVQARVARLAADLKNSMAAVTVKVRATARVKAPPTKLMFRKTTSQFKPKPGAIVWQCSRCHL